MVDCGLTREMNFDPATGISSLVTGFCSISSLVQRAGRAGRVSAGQCWRLFGESFLHSEQVQEYSTPEIRRVPLDETVLQVLFCSLFFV